MDTIDWVGFDFDEEKLLKFKRFHSENPHVAREITRRALRLLRKGHSQAGMQMLFEVLCWSHMMRTTTDEPFKLNNNYASYYSRLIEQKVPALEDFFTKRIAQADGAKFDG